RKAMARMPAERYATAEDLASDIRRWRADEPFAAHSERWAGRLARWSRRHRTAVAAGIVFLSSAVVALAISTTLVWRAERQTLQEKQHAEREWARAEGNLRDLRGVADNLVAIAEKQLSRIPQSVQARKYMTDKSLEGFRRALAQRPDDLDLQERTAK